MVKHASRNDKWSILYGFSLAGFGQVLSFPQREFGDHFKRKEARLKRSDQRMNEQSHFDRRGATYDHDELHHRIVSLLTGGAEIKPGFAS
jgi:hypothetical protein